MKNLIVAATALCISLSAQALPTKDVHPGASECITHEDNENTLFDVVSLVQKYIQRKDIDANKMKELISYDKALWEVVLAQSGALDVKDSYTPEQALNLYYNDIKVDWIQLNSGSRASFWRFSMGVADGSKVILVIRANHDFEESYDLMSSTTDSALNYCDVDLRIKH